MMTLTDSFLLLSEEEAEFSDFQNVNQAISIYVPIQKFQGTKCDFQSGVHS